MLDSIALTAFFYAILQIHIFSVLRYDVAITPANLAADNYYLSILEDDATTTDRWVWSSSDPLTGNNSYFRFFDSSNWAAGTNDPKEAFELHGSPIPEPTGLVGCFCLIGWMGVARNARQRPTP